MCLRGKHCHMHWNRLVWRNWRPALAAPFEPTVAKNCWVGRQHQLFQWGLLLQVYFADFGRARLGHSRPLCQPSLQNPKSQPEELLPAGPASQSSTTKLPRILPRHQIPPLFLGHIKRPQQSVAAGLQFAADLTNRKPLSLEPESFNGQPLVGDQDPAQFE